jgi:Acyl-CoA dehydrogenases
MNQPQPVKDASHLYEVERRAEHAARPGFRISELQLSPTQKVPWHTHTNVSDTFYVLEGQMRLFLQDPKEEVNLKPGEVYVVRPTRPHLVTNGGTKSLTFLVLQGVGEYGFCSPGAPSSRAFMTLNHPQQELQQRARALARETIAPRAAEVDRTEQYPWENVKALNDAGFFGMTIPKAYGGAGLGFLEACLVVDEVAQVCGVSGRIVVEANMGAISAVMHYGSEPQKKLAAELVLSGDKPAICITEPAAGSAASEMTTRADRKGNGYVINGGKHWITGGGVSRLHLVFARVFEQPARSKASAVFWRSAIKPRDF